MGRKWPLKIEWRNDAEASIKLLTRQWEPMHGDMVRHEDMVEDYTLDELDTIRACVWGRQKTNMVLKNEAEARVVLRFLRHFNEYANNPAHGHMWATRTTHAAVAKRIDKVAEAVDGPN